MNISSLLKVVRGIVRIRGASDGTLIGNTGDLLKVTGSILPATDVSFSIKNLLNGSSKSMNVNGSVTPVEFSYAPGAGKTEYLESLKFYLSDGGNPSEDLFGAITALTNGVKIEIRSKGTTKEYYNLKDNTDVVMGFRNLPQVTNFMAEKNIYGFRDFDPPLILKNSNSDFVKVTVRDNLTGIQKMRMSVAIWEVN